MTKAAVVILNFCNYKETKQCVESVRVQKDILIEIIIVENGSPNNSYQELMRVYGNDSHIHILHVCKNYGFAKGNNIGIKYAKQFGVEFIYLLNSDVILIGERCIADLICDYKPGIGVIGSQIIEKNGIEKKAFYGYLEFPEKWFYFFHIVSLCFQWDVIADYWWKKLLKGKKIEVLHGSNLLLTPDFISQIGFLYPHTFLYCEEYLLFLQCKERGLKQMKSQRSKIFHKSEQSTKKLYKRNEIKKMRHVTQSFIHVLLYPLYKKIVRIFTCVFKGI